MEFYNNRFKEEWERLQVELLRAEVSLVQERVEAQRITNQRDRNLLSNQPAFTFPTASLSNPKIALYGDITKTNVIEK